MTLTIAVISLGISLFALFMAISGMNTARRAQAEARSLRRVALGESSFQGISSRLFDQLDKDTILYRDRDGVLRVEDEIKD